MVVVEKTKRFLFDKISEKHKKHDRSNCGLYCSERLSVIKNNSGTKHKRITKSLKKVFREFGLEIMAESSLRIMNHLNVNLYIRRVIRFFVNVLNNIVWFVVYFKVAIIKV